MRKVKYRKSFGTIVIGIFLIFNILSIVLFTYYVTYKEESKTLEYAKESLQVIVNEKSELISISFNRIETQAALLGTWMEKLIDINGHMEPLSSEYITLKDGTITREKNLDLDNIDQSSIVIPHTTKLSDEVRQEINLSEELDEPFAKIIRSEDVTWAYIVTENNLLRCSPYSDMIDYFSSNHSQTSDVFYTIADEKNNPEKVAVWTKPYTDYLGTGWTMTCSQPIYKDNEMYGVICLDISIGKIKEKYFKGFSLGENGKVYWLDNAGNIYYHPDYDEKAENQGQVYEKNIFHDENVSENKKQVLKEALSSKSGTQTLWENGKNTMYVYSQIEGTNSTLIIEMDNGEFVAGKDIDASKATALILIELVIAAVFAVILYYKFSKPMNKLVKTSNRITSGDYSYIKDDIEEADSNIYEIARLNTAFSTMNKSIESYTKSLKDRDKEISTILKTIEGELMIVDMKGNILVRSKESKGIDEEKINNAIARMQECKTSINEQVVINGEVYKNVYYPIFNENNQIDRIVLSSECVTNTILMEKEIQQIEKMAGVGQLSAAIVHELKNSLARIKGANYILRMTADKEEDEEEIETIDKALKDAENVIETLLDYSRRDSSGSEMIHIGTLINQIILLSKKELTSRNINVKIDLDDSVYLYSSGREALKVIFQNIIINAIQAVGEDGFISITCTQEEKIRISIRDNGGGIKVEPADRVFEPFITTKETGTGIGLWITKRLVESLNGDITINDKIKGETEFIILIPVK